MRLSLAAFLLVLLAACSTHPPGNLYQPQPYVKLQHPEWSKNAAIYELNTRQFTDAGTFDAAREHLPRLKALGTDIIWLMPIHEIGEKNRKGTLGSPYAVKDFYSVNPEFGTLDDLKEFVDEAHELGMYVILDWVANHTAWDNVMVQENPDWFERDWKGQYRPTPWFDWADIIDLDYSRPEVRQYMTEALKYWVEEAGIDGYRADAAGLVPLDFWNSARRELDAIKPVFMLAEWDWRDLHAEAFDMTYAWSWNDAVHAATQGEGLGQLFTYYAWNEGAYPKDAMRMTYVSNHDLNSWEATQFERFGEGLEAAIVLSVIGDGMPLIYSGQEAGNEKRLEFFEKDPIEWREHEIGALYQTLLTLMKNNSALWHGRWGATMTPLGNTAPNEVFSFVRQNDQEKVVVAINFSDETQEVEFTESLVDGDYRTLFGGERVSLAKGSRVTLKPWGYQVFVL